MKYLNHRPKLGSLLMMSLCVLLLALIALPAMAQTASAPQVLINGQAVGSLSGSYFSRRYYAITVPAGAAQLAITTTGPSGDSDLYVRFGSVPTTSTWDYRPYVRGSNETVTVSNPRAGTWYVMLYARSSYSGLTLKAVHNAGVIAATAAATPTFTPAPGTYSGQVSVVLASSTTNAVVRYTLDGSAPSTGSEVYAGPIQVTATTQIRAAAFASGLATSTVAAGTFTIRDTVQSLSNNVPVSNLAGAQGSVANFRVAVPAGATSVTISISGGSGDADLYVKYGQLATTSVWDQRPYTGGNNETVTITSAQAGDYFVMVHGYSAYSGVSLNAVYGGTATAGKPDLVISSAALNPRITTETFSANACEIQEGTITEGTKKLLRFNTETRNIGTADLVLGNPASNPMFEYGTCHGHYHFRSFAQYRLLDNTGAVVRNGKKVGFCLMDITRVDSAANPNARYNCSSQGIQAGWADIYSSNLSGQWIDITGLPSGSYTLEIVIDPMNLIDELDETNNTTRTSVTIP